MNKSPAIVIYNNFVQEHVSGPTVDSKKSKPNAEKPDGVAYQEIPLTYNYSTNPSMPNYDNFNMELSEVSSYSGIEIKDNNYGGKTGTIRLTLDLNVEEDRECFMATQKLYGRACDILLSHKGQVKSIANANKMNITGTVKPPTYYKTDEDGNVVPGTKPSMYVDVAITGRYKTLFTSPNGDKIDYNILVGNDITLIPLVHFSRIYAGSTTRIKFSMKSAIVTSIKSINCESTQTYTMGRLNLDKPNIAKNVEEQIAKIAATQVTTPYIPPKIDTTTSTVVPEEDDSIGGSSFKAIPFQTSSTPSRSSRVQLS